MSAEILANNLEVLPQRAYEVMNEMFGSDVVTEAQVFGQTLSDSISETNWDQVALVGGIGAAAGFAVGIILTNIVYAWMRQGNYKNSHPDPAHGCGCNIVLATTAIGLAAGCVASYLTQHPIR